MAIHLPKAEQVSIASMYLAGDAKLWWQNRVQEDIILGKPKIDEWETEEGIENTFPSLQRMVDCKGIPQEAKAHRDASRICQGVQFLDA